MGMCVYMDYVCMYVYGYVYIYGYTCLLTTMYTYISIFWYKFICQFNANKKHVIYIYCI